MEFEPQTFSPTPRVVSVNNFPIPVRLKADVDPVLILRLRERGTVGECCTSLSVHIVPLYAPSRATAARHDGYTAPLAK